MNDIDLRGLDLNLLRVLHVLLEERSVSRAAVRLGVSQSAVSHALARLRRYFADPLLTRSRRGMAPTTRAEAIEPGLARLLADMATLVGPTGFDPAAAEGLIRIAASSTAMLTLVPALLLRIRRQAPRLRFECCQWSAETFDDLEVGQIDLAIGARWRREEDWVRAAPLLTERYACVVRCGHPLVGDLPTGQTPTGQTPAGQTPTGQTPTGQTPAGRRLTRAAFEAWPHLIVESAHQPADTVNRMLAMLGVHRDSAVTTHHPLTAHLLLEETDMILTVTRVIAEQYARAGQVTLLEPPVDIRDLTLFLFWHPRNTPSPINAWLRQALAEIGATPAG